MWVPPVPPGDIPVGLADLAADEEGRVEVDPFQTIFGSHRYSLERIWVFPATE
jgi:hypothetical protein